MSRQKVCLRAAVLLIWDIAAVCVLSSRQVFESYLTALIHIHKTHLRGRHMAEECVKGSVLSHCVSSSITPSYFTFALPYLAFSHSPRFGFIFFFLLTQMSGFILFLFIFIFFGLLCRQTCPCCRGSCCIVPGWPNRLQHNTWPNTSSFSWTPMPAHLWIPRRSCWR